MRDRVYIGGTFDLFHPGHIRLLARAHRYGDVWVSLNTDEFCERYKRKPIMKLSERIEVVSACRWVHGVTINQGDEDSRLAIMGIQPRFIVHGDDWTGASYLEQLGITEEWLERQGIELLYFPYTPGVSTKELIERVYLHGGSDSAQRESASDSGQLALSDEEAGRNLVLPKRRSCTCGGRGSRALPCGSICVYAEPQRLGP